MNKNVLGRWSNLGAGTALTGRQPRAGRVLFLGISICTLLGGVCLLPYAFPPSTFIKGASYEVGFNNTVAYLWYILFLWVPVLALTRMFSGISGRVPPISAPTITFVPTPLVWATIALHALMFAGLYAYKGRFVFAEALYFQTLIYRMTLGDIPYLDFDFFYGPAMLYPGYLLAPYLGVEAAYGLYFGATYLAGLYLVYLAVSAAISDSKAVDRWFLLFAIGFFNPWTGLNVTFVRFLLPVVTVAGAVSYFRTGRLRTLAAAASLLALSMLYSFEVGAVGLVGLLFLVLATLNHHRLIRLLGWLTRPANNDLRIQEGPRDSEMHWLGNTGSRVFVGRVGTLVGSAVFIYIVAFVAMDPSLRALRIYPTVALFISAGAHNEPLYPNFPFLILALLTLMAAAMVLCAARDGRFAGHEDLAVSGLVLALLMERGAFGEAEPMHFAYYGLPIFFLCLFMVRWTDPVRTVGRWLFIGLMIGIVGPLLYFHVTVFTPFVSTYWAKADVSTDRGAGTASGESLQKALVTLVERIGTDKPYLMFQLDYYSFPVYRKLGLRYPTYFTFLTNARTFDDVDLVIAQLQQTRAVVLARRSDLMPATVEPHRSGLRGWLDRLSGVHTAGSELAEMMRASEERLLEPLRRFLADSYTVGPEEDGIVALLPREVGANMSEGLRAATVDIPRP